MRIIPPGSGIIHQVNLEYLARVVFDQDGCYYPDSLVGTDSHTTMIDGLGVLGWGESSPAFLSRPLLQSMRLAHRLCLRGPRREHAPPSPPVLARSQRKALSLFYLLLYFQYLGVKFAFHL